MRDDRNSMRENNIKFDTLNLSLTETNTAIEHSIIVVHNVTHLFQLVYCQIYGNRTLFASFFIIN